MSQSLIRKELPLIALVGRPNVGKSTLFNRLVRKRIALVDDQPGVTRDRLFGVIRFDGHIARVADTGGLDSQTEDTIMSGVRAQTRATIAEADAVIVVLDSQVGLTASDRDVIDAVRKAGKLKFAVANKCDVDDHKARAADFAEIGIDTVYPVSAEHDRGTEPLLEAVFAYIKAPKEEEQLVDQEPIAIEPLPDEELENAEKSRIEWKGGPIRVAVIGRPNAGKSSLVNRLLGEERLLATDVAGTTRDAIDVALEHDGQQYIFVDTAGMRRKRSVDDKLEKWSVSAAVRSLDSADIAVVLIDGSLGPSEQDARIATLAHERGKGLVLVVNKWDIASDEMKKELEDAVLREMPFSTYATVLKVSAKTGKNVSSIYPAVLEAQKERHRRVTTGELNRFFNEVAERSPPPVQNGRRPRLYYVTQPLVRPPTFIFLASKPDDVHFSYQRFLQNQLRERYGFHGTPIWLKMRRSKNR